jgi:hypothetical protein
LNPTGQGAPASVATAGQDEDAEMEEVDTEQEQDHLRAAITYNKTQGWCTKQLTAKLELLKPKLASRIDLAKAGRDLHGERLRLLKNQETSATNLTAKMTAKRAEALKAKERLSEMIVEETEKHSKLLDTINKDMAQIIENHEKEATEAEDKLKALTETYNADFIKLDTMMKVPAAMEASAAAAMPTPPSLPRPALQAALLPVTVTLENMQAHMPGTATTEQAALLASLLPMVNAMIAAAMAQPAVPSDVTPITQPADGFGVTAKTAEEEEEERTLQLELASLNGGGKPAKMDKVNNRADPLK